MIKRGDDGNNQQPVQAAKAHISQTSMDIDAETDKTVTQVSQCYLLTLYLLSTN